jgi:hypothetical protein
MVFFVARLLICSEVIGSKPGVTDSLEVRSTRVVKVLPLDIRARSKSTWLQVNLPDRRNFEPVMSRHACRE